MSYTLTVEYTANSEKAARLTLKNEQGKTLMSKVPVATPENLPLYSEKPGLNLLVSDNTQIIRSNQTPLMIVQENSSALKSDKNLFVMHENYFNELARHIEKHDVKMIIEKVNVLWFNEKVIRSKDSVIEKIRALNEQKVIFSDTPAQSVLIKSPVSSLSKLDNLLQNSNEPKSDVKQSSNPLLRHIKNNFANLPSHCEPQHVLAWAEMYDKQEVSKDMLLSQIKKVTGFEHIDSYEFKYTEKGYHVVFLEDNSKISYDKSNRSYTMTCAAGHTTTIKAEKDSWVGSLKNPQNQEINYILTPTNGDPKLAFTGKWHAQTEKNETILAHIWVGYDFETASVIMDTVSNISKSDKSVALAVSDWLETPKDTDPQMLQQGQFFNNWINNPTPIANPLNIYQGHDRHTHSASQSSSIFSTSTDSYSSSSTPDGWIEPYDPNKPGGYGM